MSVASNDKKQPLDADTVCHASPEVVFRQIGDETILVPLRKYANDMSSIWALNDVASTIWQELDGHNSLQQLAKIVAERYDVEVAQALEDILEFVSEMLEAGLCERVAATLERNGYR